MPTKIDTVNGKWLTKSITKTDVSWVFNDSIDCSGTSYFGYNFLNTSLYMGVQLTANLTVKSQLIGLLADGSTDLYINCGSPQSRYIKLIINKTGTFDIKWTSLQSGFIAPQNIYSKLYAKVNGVDILLSTYQELVLVDTPTTVPEWAHNGTYIIDTVDNRLIYRYIHSSESTYSEDSSGEYENIFRAVIPKNWWDSKSTYTSNITVSSLFFNTQFISSSECVPALTKIYPKYIGKTIEISYTNLGNNGINIENDSIMTVTFGNEVYSGMKHIKLRFIGIPTMRITKAGVTLTININISNLDETTGSMATATKNVTWKYTAETANSPVILSNKEFYIDIVNNTLSCTNIPNTTYTDTYYKAIKK